MGRKKVHRLREMVPPTDLWDDVTGSVMDERQTDGDRPPEVTGRFTGLYRKTDRGWRLVNVFCNRRDAYNYFATLADGGAYRIAPLRGSLIPVGYGQ